MTHQEKNQLFIDCIYHWMIDAIDMFESGYTLDDSQGIMDFWDDLTECKLNGDHCKLCHYFKDNCKECFVGRPNPKHEFNLCVGEYDNFLDSPNIDNANKVINKLWKTANDLKAKDWKDMEAPHEMQKTVC